MAALFYTRIKRQHCTRHCSLESSSQDRADHSWYLSAQSEAVAVLSAFSEEALAGLHMALKDSEAAVRVMHSAVEAKRLALGPSHPAVTESVLGLAAIFRASGRSRNAVEVIQNELQFLTQEGLQASSGDISCSQSLPPSFPVLEPLPL